MPRSRRTRDVTVELVVPAQTWNKLQPILVRRGISADELCLFYLKSLVTISEKTRSLALDSEMPIGQYKGEVVETVIRAEPKYVGWLLDNSQSFRLDPPALELLTTILEMEKK